MIRQIGFLLFSFCVQLSLAQNAKKPTDFTAKEKCLYDFLLKNKVIKPGINQQASFYILQRDSFFLFQQNLERNDTVKIQVHVINKNLQATCLDDSWQITKTEFIEAGKYRGNAVFNYQNYFDVFDPFNTEYAAVKRGGKWGFVNSYGEVIIPFDFNEIKPHAFGIWLKNEAGVKIYNLKEKRASDLFDEIALTSPRILPYDNRLTIVKKGNKAGMMNDSLKLVVPLLYDNISLLSQKFLVGFKQGKVVLINSYIGKEISTLYDKVRVSADNSYLEAAVSQNGQLVIKKIDTNGTIIQ